MENFVIVCLKPPSGIPTVMLCRDREWRKNASINSENVFAIFHIYVWRLDHTFTFFFSQLQKTTSHIHSYPSIKQKLLTRMKTKTLTNKTVWLWLNARCSYYIGNCWRCYLIIPRFSSEQNLTELCLHASSEVTGFLGNNCLSFSFGTTGSSSELQSNLYWVFFALMLLQLQTEWQLLKMLG